METKRRRIEVDKSFTEPEPTVAVIPKPSLMSGDPKEKELAMLEAESQKFSVRKDGSIGYVVKKKSSGGPLVDLIAKGGIK